jgi:16S rRNA (guanine966-N2)-methyltransferase
MKRNARGPGPRTGQLRIIGGQWRGRKLRFPAVDGLRPTTDRIRETLFNWLAPEITGARCADLFAGSGALGLEALSRGAAHCNFVDRNERVIDSLRSHLASLDAQDRAACRTDTTERFLEGEHEPWDIVFVDPPFGRDLAISCCQALAQRNLVARDGLVYLETARDESLEGLPACWEIHREKTGGGVAFRLYRVP